MLLFLLRDNLPEPGYAPRPTAPTKGAYAVELLASGLFLSVWCVLRLLSAHGDSFVVDCALALPCLVLGLWVVLRSVRSLSPSTGRGRSRTKGLRAARRAHRRRQRLQRVGGHSRTRNC
jgi:hypothetical protein